MMMTKPTPGEADADTSTKPAANTTNAVQDLERRLEMLGGSIQDPPPAFESAGLAPPLAAAPAAQATSNNNKTGKNALLARIMAAQERAKQVQKTPPASGVDLLSGDAPPAFDAKMPPAFDAASLPTPSVSDAPPPVAAFENNATNATVVNLPPPVAKDPPAVAAPPMPSAPAFEDLMDASAQQAPAAATTPLPPPPAPTEEAPPDLEEFAGLEGLSEEERKALIEEQRQIMEQIANKKSGDKASEAAARAEAFDQRSNAAAAAAVDRPTRNQRTVNLGSGQEVALHGQERTKQAIKAGTAVMVQCINCKNMMQVTSSASLMFCPVCQVVSPVNKDGPTMTKEEALQMEADRKMAEQLQNEEYKRAGRETEGEAAAEARQPQQQSSSWMEWLGLSSGATTPVRPPQRPARPPQRGELGVARPPGAGEGSGAETLNFAGSGSYDEQDGLLNSGSNAGSNSGAARQGARVAEQKPLFACVADSISTAATTLSTAIQTQTLHEDKEGNIHGVDASSLLSVTQASRDNSQGYAGLRNDEH